MDDSNASPFPKATARRRLEAGVVAAGFCAFLQLYAPQPLLVMLREQFGATESRVSLTVSAAAGGVALAGPFVAAWADAIGRKRVIVPCLFMLALATLGCALAGSLEELIFWRFLGGIFTPGVIAVTLAYISEESPDTAAATTALFITGTVLGGLTGRLSSAMIADAGTWRGAFGAIAGLTCAGACLVWWLLSASKNFRRPASARVMFIAMASHLRNRPLLATYAAGFLVLFCHVGLFSYATFHLAAPPFSLSTTQLGLVFLVYALGLVITPLSGLATQRWGHRVGMTIAATLACAGAAMTLSRSLTVFMIGVSLASSGIFVAQATASSHVGKVVREARSAASGLYVSLYYLGGCVGAAALAIPWHAGGWPAIVWCVLAAQVVLVTVAWAGFKSKDARPRARPPVEPPALSGV